jgi:hypothetical protein
MATRRRARPRSPAPPRVPPEAREKLLKLLRDGHDLPSSCATASVEIDDVRADHDLMLAAGKAHLTGTGRLRTRLLEQALKGGGPGLHVLERAVAGREAQQREFPTEHQAAGDDFGWTERLSKLTDFELDIVEWLMSGLGDKPQAPLSYVEQMALMGREQAEKRAAQRPMVTNDGRSVGGAG